MVPTLFTNAEMIADIGRMLLGQLRGIEVAYQDRRVFDFEFPLRLYHGWMFARGR